MVCFVGVMAPYLPAVRISPARSSVMHEAGIARPDDACPQCCSASLPLPEREQVDIGPVG
ncbi:MAG TPA: hypothetical protein VN800_01270 [Candidatus Acidoferrales bacterium]|nr:hypothetical protein [Candidatus Acidoferrales bacterium]